MSSSFCVVRPIRTTSVKERHGDGKESHFCFRHIPSHSFTMTTSRFDGGGGGGGGAGARRAGRGDRIDKYACAHAKCKRRHKSGSV